MWRRQGLLPGDGGGQHFGSPLDGDGQYWRHHVDRQRPGIARKSGCRGQRHHVRPRKDMGSPFRVMTAEERGIFQSVIDSFYLRFLAVVQEGRPYLSADQIKKLADGRIYSGDQAKAAGLIDEIGYLDDAIEMAKKKAGLTEARVVTYGRRGSIRIISIRACSGRIRASPG